MGINDALIELGIGVDFVAVNHWDVAVQTYARNHPGASVHCVTLDAAYPPHLVPGGKLDLLTAGIECTFFSQARGGKPVNDQQRMSGWHVVRWATELRIKRLLLENVPEFVKWGPVDVRTGRPIKSREGEYFWAWWKALEAVGFELEMQVLNCADYGDATTRRRLFILGRSDGGPIRWPEPSHSREINLFGKPRWRSARDGCIDWSIRGRSIFDRKKPLAPKTLARIAAGMVKFKWPEPFLIILRQHADARGIDLPLPALCAGGTHVGLVEPFTVPLNQGRERNRGQRPVSEPMQTVTASSSDIGFVQPFILSPMTTGAPRTTDEPLPTLTLGGAGNDARPGCARPMIVSPFTLSQASGGAPRSVDDPVQAITTDGAHSMIAPYYGSGSGESCSSVNQPLPTQTAKARFGLVMPVTHGSDLSNRCREIDQPIPTLTTAKRGELAFITAAFGERPTQQPRIHSVDEPAPTVCAQGRINVVQPGRDHDVMFRMLEPHELAAAMSISEPGRPYHFVGNKTETVRQIGQAVPRRTAKALARALMED